MHKKEILPRSLLSNKIINKGIRITEVEEWIIKQGYILIHISELYKIIENENNRK